MEIGKCTAVYIHELPVSQEESMVALMNMAVMSIMSLMIVNVVSSISDMLE